jgi:hypothetical protein
LTGRTIEVDVNKGFAMGPDNHINQPLYRLKGPEVLAGKKIDSISIPAKVLDFQMALENLWPTR